MPGLFHAALTPFLVLLWCGTGCRGPAAHELLRVASPDGEVDAVLLERLTDATVSSPFEIYVVARGQIPKDELVLKVDRSDAPRLEWRANELAVRCAGARVWHFQNFATVRVPDGSFWSGKVMLACGVGIYEAPAR